MGERICSVEGCGQPHHARGWCAKHDWRARHGKPLDNVPLRPGRAACGIEGCTRKPSGPHCTMHQKRWARHGDFETVLPGTPYVGSQHPNWVGDQATYETVHWRLRATRGVPDRCEHCGANDDRAYQWALNWNVATGIQYGKRKGDPYSVDPNHYIALCLPCHRAFDLVNARRRKT